MWPCPGECRRWNVCGSRRALSVDDVEVFIDSLPPLLYSHFNVAAPPPPPQCLRRAQPLLSVVQSTGALFLVHVRIVISLRQPKLMKTNVANVLILPPACALHQPLVIYSFSFLF